MPPLPRPFDRGRTPQQAVSQLVYGVLGPPYDRIGSGWCWTTTASPDIRGRTGRNRIDTKCTHWQ